MTLLIGIAASLIATGLVWLLTRIGIERARRVRRMRALMRRLQRDGLSNFFASRADYVLHRPQTSVGEYVRTCEHELLYVGLWLAQGTEIAELRDSIRWLVNERRQVTLAFLDRESPDVHLEGLASYLNVSVGTLRARLGASWEEWLVVRASLPDAICHRLRLYSHRELLTSSAFVFDRGHPSAKTLVDIKLPRLGRESSLGIELVPVGGAGSLYERVTLAFTEVLDKRCTFIDV